MIQTPEMDALVSEQMRQHIGGATMESFILRARVEVLERTVREHREMIADQQDTIVEKQDRINALEVQIEALKSPPAPPEPVDG